VVGWRVRSGWVRWWVYERRWRSTMLMSGLASGCGCDVTRFLDAVG
jgi:hypothetical protein